MKKFLNSFLALMLVGVFAATISAPYRAHAGTKVVITDTAGKRLGEEVDITTGMHNYATFPMVDNVIAAVASGSVSGTVAGAVNTTYTTNTTLALTGVSPTGAATDVNAYRYPMRLVFSNLSTGIFCYQLTSYTASAQAATTGIPVAAGASVVVDVPLWPIPYTFQWQAAGTGTTALGYSILAKGRK